MAQNTLIYPSHYELMEELTNEQAGLLIKTIGRYQRGEDISIDDVLVKGVWLGIKHDFETQKQNYQATCERNRINGKKGGRPKTQSNPKNPSGLLETQPIPNNLKEKEKDKEKYKEKYKKKGVSSNSIDTKQSTPSYSELFHKGLSAEDYLNKNY